MKFPRRLFALAALGAGLLFAPPAASQSYTFSSDAAFAGMPAAPEPFRSYGPVAGARDWAVTTNQQNYNYWLDQPESLNWTGQFPPEHGPDCAPPPATHTVEQWQDLVFKCHDHVMTVVNGEQAGYGIAAITPPALADFSAGTATVTWHMSTARNSSRDWIDVRVERFDQTSPLAQDNRTELEAVEAQLINPAPHSILAGVVARGGVPAMLPFANCCTSMEDALAAAGLTPSATRRDTFQMEVSRTHVRIGMPAYGVWWVDTDIADLGWDRGLVTITHHSYNPRKDCDFNGTCGPTTWHWSDLHISPAQPITILTGDVEHVSAATPPRVTLSGVTPAGSFLRFVGTDGTEVSYDDGATWVAPGILGPHVGSGEHQQQYWLAAPAGIDHFLVRGAATWCCPFVARDFAVFSQTVAPVPTATPVPATPTPAPTATPHCEAHVRIDGVDTYVDKDPTFCR